MITISPISRALVPVDSLAATEVAGPNYDEFQSDEECWQFIKAQQSSILKVTMPHCDAASSDGFLEEGSDAALAMAAANMQGLVRSNLTREVPDAMFVYEMVDPTRSNVRQIGLGCYARTGEIKTAEQPNGTIIRNEGIRLPKAEGRAALVRATSSFIGTVNLAVDDDEGAVAAALEAIADAREPDFSKADHKDNHHRIWVVTDPETQAELTALMAKEPCAYVADGNHRSAAAAMLGYRDFLTVLFIADRMRIDPYHRLVDTVGDDVDAFLAGASERFDVEALETDLHVPTEVGDIGFYTQGQWYRLTPKVGTFDSADAVQTIDSDILQRNLYAPVMGIEDATDKRLTFVGGDKGVAWLKAEVDAGRQGAAFALASVTMQQFIDVCQQGRYMPPKLTWFEPKIQSGLVLALLD